MRAALVAQPFEDERSLLDYLTDVCGDAEEIFCVVAWAKRSGLAVVQPGLATFAARGGHSTLLVGIDQGLATRQGLELARALFGEVYVVHDESAGGRRTFHPKIYLASKPGEARLFVGSNNLTPGGLQGNYEAALDVALDLSNAEDASLYADVRAYIDRLKADTEVCKPLTDALLESLLGSARYRIADEDTAPPLEPDEAAARERGEPQGGPRLFGSSDEGRRPFPRAPGTAARTRRRAGGGEPARPGARAAPASGASLAVIRRWFKRMPASDAQRPPRPNSNITGALRLTRAGHPIDQRTYFRDEFFRGAAWRPDPERPGGEVTDIDFDVVVGTAVIGQTGLRVVHDPRRVAGQGNFATTIRWGPLIETLRAGNYVGQHVTLEQLDDGTYRLIVAPTPTGSFMR